MTDTKYKLRKKVRAILDNAQTKINDINNNGADNMTDSKNCNDCHFCKSCKTQDVETDSCDEYIDTSDVDELEAEYKYLQDKTNTILALKQIKATRHKIEGTTAAKNCENCFFGDACYDDSSDLDDNLDCADYEPDGNLDELAAKFLNEINN